MRARILFVSLICLMLCFIDSAVYAVESKAAATIENSKLRESIDKSFTDLIARIKSSKDLKKDWKDLLKVETEARALRKKEKRQPEYDEIHLDSLLAALHEIPREKKFNKADCADYKTSIHAGFAPYPKEDGEMPEFVKISIGVLDALCAK